MRALTCLLLLPAVATAAETETRVVVLPLEPGHGIERGVAEVATNALATSLQAAGVQVITPRDVESVLGFESEKARVRVELARRMGDEVCVDDQTCLTELGGALGAARVIAGSVSRIGSTAVLSTQLFDPRRAVVLERFQGSVKSDDDAAFLGLATQAAGVFATRGEPDSGAAPPATASSSPAGATLTQPPSGSACDAHWRAYVAAASAIPAPIAARAAAKRDRSIERATRILPMVLDAAQRSALEFALSELYAEELLYRLLVSAGTDGSDAITHSLRVASLRIDRALLQQPSFPRWTETLFRSSLVHYVSGELRSAKALCRRLPPGFRPALPTL